MLCHDAKFLCQSYVVCVLVTEICRLQRLVEGNNSKKWDMNIFKFVAANRTFTWDLLLTAPGEEACDFGTRFSWNICFPSTIFLSLWRLFKMKYVFLILFISIWQMDSRNSCESDRQIWQLYCKEGWKCVCCIESLFFLQQHQQ